MYKVPAYYEISLRDRPSTVMYACENFLKDLDSQLGGKQKECTSSLAPGGVNTAAVPSARSPKKGSCQKSSAQHKDGVSEMEQCQLALLNQLQQLSSRLDKLLGKPDGKKRAKGQAKEVKRQKTESSCIEEPAVYEPETMEITETVEFAVYGAKDDLKSLIKAQFPLIIVIGADSSPPLSIFILASLFRERAAANNVRIGISSFVHSSVPDGNGRLSKSKFMSECYHASDVSQCDAMINIIWKKEAHSKGPILLQCDSSLTRIIGELAVSKYLAELADFCPVNGDSPRAAFVTWEYWMFTAEGFAKPAYSEVRRNVLNEMNGVLGKRRFVIGNRLSLADVYVWSVLNQAGIRVTKASILPVPPNVKQWMMTLNSLKQFQAARAVV